MELRGTQAEFVDRGVEILTSKSTRKTLMVAPVAYGKSICVANIVARLDGPVIVLQPNKELLEQNYGKYTDYGFQATVFSASMKQKELSDVTYASIKSIKSHLADVQALKVKYMIIDECHIATGNSGEIAKFIKAAKIKNVLGVTATPISLAPGYDGTMLKTIDRYQKNLFTGIGHVVQIEEMTRQNHWAELVYDLRVTHVPHLSYNSAGSEYDTKSMDAAYVESRSEEKCVEAIRDLKAEGRKSILVFVPSIKAAVELQAKVPGSEVVHGKTKLSDRKRIIQGFKSLDIQVVINVEVLTTGFDHPQLDAIVMARPTASIHLYYQILGRGTRIHPLKANTKIVDLSGNVSNFGPIEDLNYEYIDGYGWGLYSGDVCLTDTPIKARHDRPTKKQIRMANTIGGLENLEKVKNIKLHFGKYEGKTLQSVPKHYLSFILDNFSWNGLKMMELKKAIEIVIKIN